MINYFNFRKLGSDYLITNDFGKYLFVTQNQLAKLVGESFDYQSDYGRVLCENLFAYNGSQQAFLELSVPYMRESRNYLFSASTLHIFVVTTACNLQCVYCQAQNGMTPTSGMMTEKVAKKAVDIALQSPEQYLTFEFQGGEPLINFEIIKYIVEYTERSLEKTGKCVTFNIVSNLSLLTDEIIQFIKKHHIGVSTSLDGSEHVHNCNRPTKLGTGSFHFVKDGIQKLVSADIFPGAIETTTRLGFQFASELIDTYLSLGLNSIFIRPLTPLGCAASEWESIGYTPEEFIDFYRDCFSKILEINRRGIILKEGHAALMLQKILTGAALNYMELRSPCGAGIGQIAYYYNGQIYTCDEGRMLAEMGDSSFYMGNVFEHSYSDIMNSSACKVACVSSLLESLPNCHECAYQPYCGTCPVVNYAQYNNIFPNQPNDYKCRIYKGMFDTIFKELKDESTKALLFNWI